MSEPKVDSASEERPALLDIPALARLLGTTVRHVRRLVGERRVPYIKVGHFIRFDPSEIEIWLEAQRVPDNQSRRAPGKYRGVGAGSVRSSARAEGHARQAPYVVHGTVRPSGKR